jgi:hypothetical protein
MSSCRGGGTTPRRHGRGHDALEQPGELVRAAHVADRVEPLEQRLTELERGRTNDRRFLTTAEYAERFNSTPAAVLARINRRTLHAIKPPGSREWLIPVDEHGYDGRQ